MISREEWITRSEEETRELGRRFAADAAAGSIFCLDGDLGAGKTVWAKGFAEGLGVTSVVTSPTFTLLRTYTEGRLPLYHFDVYRIRQAGEMYELGFDEFLWGEGVCLIEWADNIRSILPTTAVFLNFERMPDGETVRKITCSRENYIADGFCQ